MRSVTPSPPVDATAFYVDALACLERTGVPFVVGGAYAFAWYTKIVRDTKDFDVFLHPDDVRRVLAAFDSAGYEAALPFPHWLGKVWCSGYFIDLIFSSGNGLARVDHAWFEHAVDGEVLGRPMRLCPPEEMIWSKSFVQERERFDGADVIHLFRALGPTLDWARLLARFAEHWRVLLSAIVMYGFVYPDERPQIPAWVMSELTMRLQVEAPEPQNRVCNGTLLSREQYLFDLERFGYKDARVRPIGRMTKEETEIWTRAIEQKD